MAYDIPSINELIAEGEADIELELGSSLPPIGTENALNISTAMLLRDLYDHQTWISKQIVPSSESDDDTILQAAIDAGLVRKQPTYAYGYVQYTSSVDIALDTEIKGSNGLLYTVTVAGVSSSGIVTVEVQAQDPGSSANLATGSTMTLVETLSGANPNGVVIDDGITGGYDIETISELLDRLLYRRRHPPIGGGVHDYVSWMREVSGVTRGFAWDSWYGKGTVGVAFCYDNRTDILPSSSEISAMAEYIQRHDDPSTGISVGKPAGIEVVSVGLTLKQTSLNVHLTPDTTDNRTAVTANILALQKTLLPGDSALITAIRKAISDAPLVTDYTLDITSNVTSNTTELIVFEVTYV